MRKIVISLGGSVIVPEHVDYKFLENFTKLIKKFKKDKIVIVTGGGHTARDYIDAVRKEKLGEDIYSWVGIATTKLNARLLSSFFGKIQKVPDSLEEVKNAVKKSNLVICGALGFQPGMTSDANAAEIAVLIKADFFVNITNVKGLYDKDPNKFKNAKFISKISFDDFYDLAKKIKFEAGQHFVLDQVASKIIKEKKIKTYIMGRILKNIEKLLKEKKFIGTIINKVFPYH